MTVLWESYVAGTHYSVRQVGASIRLYSNRVFHSQWNPNKPFSGGVWDCLSLPAFYIPNDSVKRVLLLGLGGGAVVRQLQLISDFSELIAVEIDKEHVEIARRWFGVDDSRVKLLRKDAISWLYSYRGAPFDLIIDDLFGHEDEGEPTRACALTSAWTDLLHTHLKRDGLLVVNCVNSKEMKQAIPALIDSGFRSGYRWTLPTYENSIAVLSNKAIHARDWSRNLEKSRLSQPSQKKARATLRKPLKGFFNVA